jgi:transaldolase
MKIFLDTANIPAIKQLIPTGLIDGVTTNPTHLSKEGNDPKKQVLEICALLPHGEISVEVTEMEPNALYKQAQAIAHLSDNIIVKIPCHKNYYAVIKKLVAEKIPINVTLVFSLTQGLMMSKLGVRYISPFMGRLDDNGGDSIALLAQLRSMIDQYNYSTHILAASVRNGEHCNGAIIAGADVITLSPELLEKICAHPLTDQGMAQFLHDWKKLNITQFP